MDLIFASFFPGCNEEESTHKMKRQAVYIVTLMSFCCCGAYGLKSISPIGNCPRCKKFDVSTFEPLKRVAMIKAEIMRRLGISQQQTERNTEPITKHGLAFEHRQRKTSIDEIDKNIQRDDTHELSELLSYSELSGKLNTTDRYLENPKNEDYNAISFLFHIHFSSKQSKKL